jgi:hypothetical protein
MGAFKIVEMVANLAQILFYQKALRKGWQPCIELLQF